MEAHGLRPTPGNNRCQRQPPARKLVRYLRKDQVRKKSIKFWTEPRPCIILGLKPIGKPSTKIFIITSFGQNQGLIWSSDSSLWGNQVQKFLLLQVLDITKALYGPRTQAYGETKYKNFHYYKFWSEPRPCMVLGLKPMGKPSTKIFIITSFGRNQGVVRSSDPSLRGNQLLG